mgnify:CR=1 FL=1
MSTEILKAVAKLESRLEKMDDAIRDHTTIVDNRLDSIDLLMVKQGAILEHHIRRTELAEEAIQLTRAEFAPVSKHVQMMNGGAKAIAFTGTVAGIVTAFYKLFW